MGDADNAGLCSQVTSLAVSGTWHLCLTVSTPINHLLSTSHSSFFPSNNMAGNKRKHSDDGAAPPRGPSKRLKADGTGINNGNHEEHKIPILEKVSPRPCSYSSYLQS